MIIRLLKFWLEIGLNGLCCLYLRPFLSAEFEISLFFEQLFSLTMGTFGEPFILVKKGKWVENYF